MSREQGWIGVDLDGTLAYYDGWKGPYHIGEPIPDMAQRVLAWLKQGKRVKIVTARANDHTAIHCIHLWLEKWGCPILEVTDRKDFKMVELWDDRAVRVVPNTGKPCCGGDGTANYKIESYAKALQAILELDPAETVEGYNEWGEALCLGYAKQIARAALVGDPLPKFNIPAPE